MILILLFGLLSLSHADLKLSEFAKPSEIGSPFLEAEKLEFQRPDGITLRGAAFGPPTGEPILLSPGFFGSAYYMSEVAELLARDGYRVYIYSLRGKGQGELYSSLKEGRQAKEGLFGFDRMVMDKYALIDAIYEIHKKPLVLVGHSLSGLIIRAVQSGINTETHRVNKRLEQAMSKKVASAILLKSPSPVISKADDFCVRLNEQDLKEIERGQRMVLEMMPQLAKFKESSWVKMMESLLGYHPLKDSLSRLLISAGGQAYPEIIEAKDLKGSKAYEVLTRSSARKIEPDILKDILRFTQEGFVSRGGLDMAEVYFNKDRISSRFPMTIVSGNNDILAPSRFAKKEASYMGYSHHHLLDSHMAGLFGEGAKKLYHFIKKKINTAGKCKGLF